MLRLQISLAIEIFAFVDYSDRLLAASDAP